MRSITTVQGDISPGQLGFCQSHEHLSIARGYPAQIFSHQCIDDEDLSSRELEQYRQAGGCAVVDAQPVGCGRDARMLEEISRRSGVHIICSTGFHKMLFYPEGHWVYSFTVDELACLYIEELTRGMYVECDTGLPGRQTACRAGQVKAALDAGALTGQYKKMFRAAAKAANHTKAALMVHIESGSDPVALADFLQNEGVDPQRMIFCHMDRSIPDLAVHKKLCARGIYMEYDTVARPRCHSDEREAEIVLEMLEAGYESRLLMSLDVTRDRLLSYGGTVGLGYIRKTFLPALSRRGVSTEQLESIFVTNPGRIFAR